MSDGENVEVTDEIKLEAVEAKLDGTKVRSCYVVIAKVIQANCIVEEDAEYIYDAELTEISKKLVEKENAILTHICEDYEEAIQLRNGLVNVV